jgi:cardiolipin synthase
MLDYWPHLGAALTLGIEIVASLHALLNKRDVRAAIGWVALIWLTPLVGALLYWLLGINRVQRLARSLRGDQHLHQQAATIVCSEQALAETLTPGGQHLQSLVRLVGQLTRRPLLEGNQVTPLADCEQTYTAMLEAIDGATHSITLETYIFNNDPTGQRFAAALGRAVKRGVEVRVLIDAIGSRYTWPSIVPTLRRANVRVARFLPVILPIWMPYANLRSHRKIMVVDGRIGFTGGINIREPGRFKLRGTRSIQDLHFQITGPVVGHLQQVFADDWEFATKEALSGEIWFPPLECVGDVLARGISDGPDLDIDKFRLTLLGALACAQSSVRIVTPYFVPDLPLITALNVAAMRGVEVDILLPEKNNLLLVHWAASAQLWQVLERGCRVWYTPPPFDHTKLMIVDRRWTLLGSGNWDARSLRLNFEFNVECYNSEVAESLEALVFAKRARARQITLAEADGRPLPIRIRDGIARLGSPYL